MLEETSTPAETQPRQSSAPPAADLNSILSEFDTATAKPESTEQPPAVAPSSKRDQSAEPQQQDAAAKPSLDQLLHDAGAAYLKESVTQPPEVGAELMSKLAPLAHAVEAIQAEQQAMRDKADFANVVKL